MSDATQRSRCERARAWAALAPDDELALLERKLRDVHVSHCPACRCFAQLVADVAAELRAAAVERPSLRVVLPPVPARRSAYVRLRHAGSLAAVAAMALGVAAQAPVPSDRERPSAPRAAAPAEVDDAELHTIRLLRREAMQSGAIYPERPSGTFGTRPA